MSSLVNLAQQSEPTPQDTSAFYDTPSVQDDIFTKMENALFGGSIAQTAPELAGLSDSSQMGGIDYSFYSNPRENLMNYMPATTDLFSASPIGMTDLTYGDPVQNLYSQLPAMDMSQYDMSDSGAYMNADGTISY